MSTYSLNGLVYRRRISMVELIDSNIQLTCIYPRCSPT